MAVINRYLSEQNLRRLKRDFAFLLKWVRRPQEEMHICLRNDYFNIYFKGNSVAKVEFLPGDRYQVTVHEEFVGNSLDGKGQFTVQKNMRSGYCRFAVGRKLIHPLLQKQHLRIWCRNISQRHFSEELAFEQLLISDNLDNPDVAVVDRQVRDTVLTRRMDLLLLRRGDDGLHHFEVVEVKIGNSPDLRDGKVIAQLDEYVAHLRKFLDDYRECYTINLRQQAELRLPGVPTHAVQIGDQVSGRIVVTGYATFARQVVEGLKAQSDEFVIQTIFHRL